MAQKSPNAVDRHVGARIRMRRLMLDMSQTMLANQLGLTFQQVQKYEKGTNRVGASRLQQLGQVLGVPIAFFFEDMPGQKAHAGGSPPSYVSEFLASPDGIALVRAFTQIKDPKLRRRIVDLVDQLALAKG